ncbi:MAG TPA: ABC transporter ATP-binding protein [Kofleriaceae bacterium]|jgi:lipooligosaccharide transport system ATP-binding protein
MPERDDSLLRVEHLSKRYALRGGDPPFLQAVADVSFEVRAGECFGLLGPNGAGKSTTIHCICGLFPPTSGSVSIGGFDVARDPRRARQLLGVCSQEDTLDTDFAVRDQLVRYGRFFRISKAEGRRRADELLARFGLEAKSSAPIESLSGGMRRRLQVARSLISDPKLLVLDEPTTGLDPEVRRVVWQVLVDRRAAGVGLLLSTHYMDEAERLCDRIAIIHGGKILDIAPPSDLIARHVGSAEVAEEIRPGVVWRRPPNLEDVYLKLTGSKLEAENHA